MLRISRTRSYTVPMILRALDILELLSGSKTPLKRNEISDLMQIPRTTTFRILRTFLERGYIHQNLEGQFVVGNPKRTPVVPTPDGPGSMLLNHVLESDMEISIDRVIETFFAALQGLKRRNAANIRRKTAGKG